LAGVNHGAPKRYNNICRRYKKVELRHFPCGRVAPRSRAPSASFLTGGRGGGGLVKHGDFWALPHLYDSESLGLEDAWTCVPLTSFTCVFYEHEM
jgi:hypothetical protein